jgi:hypothetical protein
LTTGRLPGWKLLILREVFVLLSNRRCFMKDPVEAQLKAEIDTIMENVNNILEKIENFDTNNQKSTYEDQDE